MTQKAEVDYLSCWQSLPHFSLTDLDFGDKHISGSFAGNKKSQQLEEYALWQNL